MDCAIPLEPTPETNSIELTERTGAFDVQLIKPIEI